MNLYLAESGGIWNAYMKDEDFTGVKILESFFYISKDPRMTSLIPYFSDFLLDSGAFTFMMGNHKGEINWQEYTEKYAAFINTNKINKFFELDIDSIVGYEKVKELRKGLESLTGKQPIPVWHKSRGKDEFLRMADEYKYVALGGIVSKEWSKDEHKFFPWFINEAHKRNAKIHGLGYTNLEGLKKYHFDSVDSTAWTAGNRFGYIYKFDGSTMKKYDAPPGHRLADTRKAALINFGEWVKFQNYAEAHL
nr:MAG TPA: Queuine tRNA-ribosyltransferase catalytic subunit 1, queuine, tRNA, TRANSFERASE [Caudoviricetes sp.]